MISDEGFAVPVAENPELSSAPAVTSAPEPKTSLRQRDRFLLGFGIALMAFVGTLGLFRELTVLWAIWTLEPLRSIGMLIPPVSIWLTLRVWRRHGWQMRGTWWGLALIGLAYALNLLQQRVLLLAVFGSASLSFIPLALPLYLYGSGIVLLFAGTEVWRKAWFPLGLLLLSQPVPVLTNGLIDIPLQYISARVARSFATLIHFAPNTPQLRLMFSPSFGMFIAPGCDGIRGAITMGYVALIVGYLKRFTLQLWAVCVGGAVLLGYVFNFLRLCILVLYYRIALGHPALENAAELADYLIGSCLFLVATILFLWVVSRKRRRPIPEEGNDSSAAGSSAFGGSWIKCIAFAVMVLAAVALPSSGLNTPRSRMATPQSLAARMPEKIGGFTLTRTWTEQSGDTPAVEAGAYTAPGSDEITLGVYIAPLVHIHDANACWLSRGLEPELLVAQPFIVSGQRSVPFITGFYSDGITDSIVVSAVCTRETCSQIQSANSAKHIEFIYVSPKMDSVTGSTQHPVSIMVRIDRAHANEPKVAIHRVLTEELQRFLANLDATSLSDAFQ